MVQENRLKVQFTSLGELRESTTVSGLVASCCKITIDNHDNSGHIFEVSVPLYITLNPLPCFRKFPPTFLKHFFRFLARAPCAAPKIGKNAKFYGRNSAEIFRKFPPTFLKHFFRFLVRAPCAAPKIRKNAKFYGRNSAEIFRRISEKFRRIFPPNLV